MKHRPSCFISYAHVDKEFVRSEIVPILNDLGINVWIDYQQIEFGEFIADAILRGIRKADFIVAVFNRRSTYLNFEVGAAIGQSKPTLALVREEQIIPGDISYASFIRYAEHELDDFKNRFRCAIHVLLDQVIDKSVFQLAQGRKVIGIRVGIDKADVEQELRL